MTLAYWCVLIAIVLPYLATGYANLCDLVFAPSRSVADLLRVRGVRTRVEIVPTGVDVECFARGDGHAFRRA